MARDKNGYLQDTFVVVHLYTHIADQQGHIGYGTGYNNSWETFSVQ